MKNGILNMVSSLILMLSTVLFSEIGKLKEIDLFIELYKSTDYQGYTYTKGIDLGIIFLIIIVVSSILLFIKGIKLNVKYNENNDY